jgi:hypothetical protein
VDTCPVMKRKSPAFRAVEYGATGLNLGTFGTSILIFSDIVHLFFIV